MARAGPLRPATAMPAGSGSWRCRAGFRTPIRGVGRANPWADGRCADLVVFPESFPFGRFPATVDTGVMFTAAAVVPYPTVEAAKKFGRANGAWPIVPTFIQPGENTCYNAAFPIDLGGEVVAEYRQQSVGDGSGWHGQLSFSPGDRSEPPVRIGGRTVGGALGHDPYDPSIFIRLARAGAEIVVVPAAVVDGRHQDQLEALARRSPTGIAKAGWRWRWRAATTCTPCPTSCSP